MGAERELQSLENISEEFPVMGKKLENGHPLIYLDSAATTLKPRVVVERVAKFYLHEASNVHRGAHYLSDLATESYEAARAKVCNFLGAAATCEIVFTSGTTESINLVSQSFGKKFFSPGDEIVLSEMEHHSNIVPWQMLAQEMGLKLKVIPIDADGELDFEKYTSLLCERTKMVAITHCSNALGTVNPVDKFITKAHEVGAKVLIDGAQSVGIQRINVQAMDCDFFAFSTHKLFGPFGHGVLYGKQELLDAMDPYKYGGSMIDKVSFAGTSFLGTPQRFEAGTPHIAGAVGLATAIDFVADLGLENMAQHEQKLVCQLEENINSISGYQVVGRSNTKVNIVSFLLEGVHPSDIGALLDKKGLALRVGHHCTQPLMERLKISGTVRASFSVYNSVKDVVRLSHALEEIKEFF